MFTICFIAFIIIVFAWLTLAAVANDREMVETAKKLQKLNRDMGKESSLEDCALAYCRGVGFHMPVSFWIFTIGGCVAFIAYSFIF